MGTTGNIKDHDLKVQLVFNTPSYSEKLANAQGRLLAPTNKHT